METQNNYQAEIAQLEAKLAAISQASQETEARIAAQEQSFVSLQTQIDEIRLPQRTPNSEIIKDDIIRLSKSVEELNNQLLIESQSYTEVDASFTKSIENEKLRHSALSEQTKSTLSISDEELNILKAEISKIQTNAQSLNQDLLLLGSERERLVVQSGSIEQDLNDTSKLQHQIVEQISHKKKKNKLQEEALSAELHALQAELKGLDQQIQQEKIQSSTKAATFKEAVESASLQLKNELAFSENLTAQNSKLNALINEAANQQTKTSELDARSAQLQQEVHGKEAVVQQLKKTANSLKQDIKREDERIKQQQKKSQKKNYKQLTVAAHRENEGMQKQKEREQNILNNTIKTRSGYVSKDNLQILQRQLNRHNNPYASSLDNKVAQSNKLQLRNKQLNDNINRLKMLSNQAQGREQRALNESKKKRDIVTSSKLQIDKQITESTYKLNQYIKNFPNHERKLEQKIKQELKIKKTTSLIIEQPASLSKHEKKQKKNKKEKKEEDFIILEDGQLPEQQPFIQSKQSEDFKNTKWFKRRNSQNQQGPERSLYQNQYFQAAAILFAILLVTIFIM